VRWRQVLLSTNPTSKALAEQGVNFTLPSSLPGQEATSAVTFHKASLCTSGFIEDNRAARDTACLYKLSETASVDSLGARRARVSSPGFIERFVTRSLWVQTSTSTYINTAYTIFTASGPYDGLCCWVISNSHGGLGETDIRCNCRVRLWITVLVVNKNIHYYTNPSTIQLPCG